jgi:hypothetical protein
LHLLSIKLRNLNSGVPDVPFFSSAYLNPYFEQAQFGNLAQLFGITKTVLIIIFLLDQLQDGARPDGRRE